jgi:polyisoprenoid-binding protein YceI
MKECFNGLLAVAAACLVAGCSDPANNVTKSTTTEARDTTPTPSAASQYTVRAESRIDFVGSKVTGKHDGGFKKFAGAIGVADGKIAGSPEIKIDMKSTWSDNDRLTGHLKSPDFFDVEKFPSSTFTVTGVEPSGEKQTVTGNLTLHGVTKSISFPADIRVSDSEVAVKAEFAINRKDFGIVYPGKPDDLIRDNVVLKLDIKATPGEPRPEDQL